LSPDLADLRLRLREKGRDGTGTRVAVPYQAAWHHGRDEPHTTPRNANVIWHSR